MASVSFEILRNARSHFSQQVEDLTVSLSNIHADISQLETNITKYVNDQIISKKLYGYIIAQKIEPLKQIDALAEVHHAMSRYQEVSIYIQTEILSKLNTLSSDATSLFNITKIELINSEVILRNISTSAQREAEVAFQLSKPSMSYSKITTATKNVKAMCSMIDEQISYLNKLDAMLRLKFNMKMNSNYLDNHGSGNVGDVDVHRDEAPVYEMQESEI